jgi:Ca-activated chloride channel family protein
MMAARVARAGALLASCWLISGSALAWEPFRSQNSEVLEGNEHLAKGQLPEAITAYEAAAKRLPNEPGVHLDRGLALLKAGKLPQAREALRLATQGSPDAELRGKANYNLGLAFLREADAAGKQENTDEAQKLLREAADAFKSSLRASPKNRDAAWNLELTRRRLLDLEKKQQEKKQQDQEKKKQDQEKKQQEQQKQDGQDDQNGDQEPSDEDQPQSSDAGQQPPEADAGEPDDPEKEKDAAAPEPEQQQAEPKPNDPQQAPQQADGAGKALPEHMEKALDALEDSEENLQKHRAAQRARQRPRRIEKDW